MSATPALQSVCVFCGSACGADAAYATDAAALGAALAQEGVTLVYGGGGVGLMGECARAVLAGGGRVIGIIPQFLCTPEVALYEAELQVVQTMHERKAAMFDQADAFVVLPGGVGTLEEVIELLSWARMNLHRKPIVFLDTLGYWSPLVELIDHTVRQGFTPSLFRQLYRVTPRVEDVLPTLRCLAGYSRAGGARDIALT